MKLPEALRDAQADLEKALAAPRLGVWPMTAGKDDSFAEAAQPKAIARVLIDELHSHLGAADIAYLFKKDMAENGITKLGKATHAGGQLHFLTDHDFVLTFNWTAWSQLTAEQKIALVDHELCHCAMEDEVYGMRPHDVEEFGAIVRRWGLWKPDLRKFAVPVVEAASQTDLFTAPDIAEAIDQVASVVDGKDVTSLEISSGGKKVKIDKAAANRIHEAAASGR